MANSREAMVASTPYDASSGPEHASRDVLCPRLGRKARPERLAAAESVDPLVLAGPGVAAEMNDVGLHEIKESEVK
eukprot:CAMPEP_0114449046 /NCGR_PEP_ID=MMETSP0103-20121206/20653_1 /TAXON_ID=37642 ORGANISM="Paraphysomonas imperforata, Strain PA2" /NCGR_SAMPLE_ID=MMETSP0103 /ASSEMBLY_ACC=CAM_ASM_000201 /LENGTH=75 /DNA_ID=CAMNT_0001621109 /DNA_START=246 /DNA_END=470 /DNA_ORIENTATION=-